MRFNNSDAQEWYAVIRFFFIGEIDGRFNIAYFFCDLFNFDVLWKENKYTIDISEIRGLARQFVVKTTER